MKRFFIFLLILAIALGGLYVWWQLNAVRVIDAQVKELARGFVLNPENLTITTKPAKMIGLREARLPLLIISGKQLRLRSGGQLAYAKLLLKNVDVSGPPFHFSQVGGGNYTIVATDKDVTDYMRKRGVTLHGLSLIPLDTLKVGFSQASGTTVSGQAALNLPFIHQKIPMVASGELLPSSKVGQVDFRVKTVKLVGISLGVKQVTDALGVINPVVDVSEWPLESEIKSVKTGDGTVTLRAQITGVQPSLLP